MVGARHNRAVGVLYPSAYPRLLSSKLVARGCFPQSRFLVCSFGKWRHRGAIARERILPCASDHLLPPLAVPLDALNAALRSIPRSMRARAVARRLPLPRRAPPACHLRRAPPVPRSLRVRPRRSARHCFPMPYSHLSGGGEKIPVEPLALRKRSHLRNEGLELDDASLSDGSLILPGYPRYYPRIWYGTGVFAEIPSRYARINQRLLGTGGARREESRQCREYR